MSVVVVSVVVVQFHTPPYRDELMSKLTQYENQRSGGRFNITSITIGILFGHKACCFRRSHCSVPYIQDVQDVNRYGCILVLVFIKDLRL